jgi:hypothetical protein
VRREGDDIAIQGTELIGWLSERVEERDVTRHFPSSDNETWAVRRPLDTVDRTILCLRDRTGDRTIEVDDEETSVAIIRITGGVNITVKETARERQRIRSIGKSLPKTWKFESRGCLQPQDAKTFYIRSH